MSGQRTTHRTRTTRFVAVVHIPLSDRSLRQELEAIKARVRDMEEEAEKLRQMQEEVEKQMNSSTTGMCTAPRPNAGLMIWSDCRHSAAVTGGKDGSGRPFYLRGKRELDSCMTRLSSGLRATGGLLGHG